MQLNKIKLVIFDLDGVLTETSACHFKAWKTLAKNIGIKLDDAFESQLKGVSRKDSLDRILESHQLNQQFTDSEKDEFLKKKNNHYQELISHMSRSNLYEGVIELFEFLLNHQIKIALGSASKNAPQLINMLEINQYIDYIVNPKNLRSKPAPDIFLDAMNHFGYQPSECIGIEDAISGITAINKAEMTSIGIGSENELKHANYCFSSINDISLDFMKSLLKGDAS